MRVCGAREGVRVGEGGMGVGVQCGSDEHKLRVSPPGAPGVLTWLSCDPYVMSAQAVSVRFRNVS